MDTLETTRENYRQMVVETAARTVAHVLEAAGFEQLAEVDMSVDDFGDTDLWFTVHTVTSREGTFFERDEIDEFCVDRDVDDWHKLDIVTETMNVAGVGDYVVGLRDMRCDVCQQVIIDMSTMTVSDDERVCETCNGRPSQREVLDTKKRKRAAKALETLGVKLTTAYNVIDREERAPSHLSQQVTDIRSDYLNGHATAYTVVALLEHMDHTFMRVVRIPHGGVHITLENTDTATIYETDWDVMRTINGDVSTGLQKLHPDPLTVARRIVDML